MSMLGTPGQLATLLASIADAVDGEQEEVFSVDGVRDAAEHLRRLLEIRLDEADNQGGAPMTTATLARRSGRQLIEPDLFDRLVRRVASDQDLDDDLAVRIVDQALVFLQACANNPRLPFAPSAMVDHGWHAFLLHTRDYAEFCDQIASRFIHHHPTAPGEEEPVVIDTVKALEATGLHIDLELWTCPGDCRGRCQKCKKCHQCHRGCHDSS